MLKSVKNRSVTPEHELDVPRAPRQRISRLTYRYIREIVRPVEAEVSTRICPLSRRDAALGAEVQRLASAAGAVTRADRMALLSLALPVLDALSPAQATALEEDLGRIAASGGAATPFELMVRRAVLRRLARDSGRPPRPRLRQLDEVGPECLEVLSTLAWFGGRDQAAAQAALDAGVRALGARSPWRLLPRARVGTDRLDAALTALDGAAPGPKARLVQACAASALADAQVTAEEAELVRAVSAALGLPMPPVLEGSAPPPGR